MSWYLDNNNRLTNDDLPESISGGPILSTSTPPMYGYPATFWHYDGEAGKLVLNNVCYTYFDVPPIVDAEAGRDDYAVLTSPYPASFWYLDETSKLHLTLLPTPIISATLVKPYPASFWYIDEELDNRLNNALIPDSLDFSSFYGCANLTYIRIPPTVERIQNNAFYNTALTLVRLPSGCTYEKRAFPPDCEIQFYDV